MKKIAIIGAGWVGCHLAKNLKDNHNVKLIDKSGIFAETSFRNQNRLCAISLFMMIYAV